MGDIALDLAKKAVEGTVSRVLTAIDEDTKQKAVGRQDLRFIVGEFQMLQSFLEMVNDDKKRTSNKVVKTWVRQLRELAFDVEDCVEFVVHLDTTSTRIWWSWVWRMAPLPSWMTPVWVENLNQAFAQLKELKARVDEVSQRNTRYNLFGRDEDSGSSITMPPVLPEQIDATAAFPSTVDILRDLWKANAKQSSSFKCNLKYLVTDGRSKELRVISVWRSEGVDLEAAHVLNTAYSDPEIYDEFKARARVKLMHPFNIQEFLKSLLNQIYVTSLQLETHVADLLRINGESVIQHELRQLLSKHKYLIILEDLSSTVEWDLIRSYLPDHQNGSRIVISTKQLGFALSCTGEPYRVLQLALFPNDRYIYAFYKRSGIDAKELVTQLGHRRVISVWGDKGGDTSSLVRDVCETVSFRVGFKELVCAYHVPSPFSLERFCWNLPGYGNDVDRWYHHQGVESFFAEYWSKYVCETCILIVIDGLRSKEDWDELKKAGLVPEDTKSCVVIIANEEAVAKHCEDNSCRKIFDEDLEEANNVAVIFAQKSSGIGITELVRQLEQHRVISLWGDEGRDRASLVRDVYDAIILNGSKQFKGVNFQSGMWVNVPSPFSLEGLCRCLPWYVSDGYRDPESYFAGFWKKEVCEYRKLIVLEGLQSKEDWDLIKDALMPENTKSCIVIIANEEVVAKHCKDDESLRKMDNEGHEEANNVPDIISPLCAPKSFSIGTAELIRQLGLRRVISLWGDEGGDTTGLVREVFAAMKNGTLGFKGAKFEHFEWVNVPIPFSLEGLCQCLPSYVDNGYENPESYFADWSKDVCESSHLYIIEGLQSKEDWDLIKGALVPEDTKSCIVIISNEEAVTKHCDDHSWRKMDDVAIIAPLFAQKTHSPFVVCQADDWPVAAGSFFERSTGE